ncbi:MAG TPA: DUF2062 domain-containing protein [Deltaproteobacteria bacterium]|nr:DUF2062 domain-containing protein [Deltaproteobacteria bacterium]HOM29206.1 DUF2062 domain-containing protein [Deltaproteobacteria bacterium]HPP81206.1 DUF2062 domain-containing protein [Deltaproteobacteria bacterium]
MTNPGRLVHTHVVAPLKALLNQGITPGRLAASMACGITVGVSPLVGTTTAFCTMLALALRMNLLAIQLGNWLALPVQLALIAPFLMMGNRLFGDGRHHDWASLALLVREDAMLAVQAASRMVIHGALAWALCAPAVFAALFALLLPAFRMLGGLNQRSTGKKG